MSKPAIKIASWNVNSVKSRLEHLTEWLKTSSPDVVLLQELKTVTDGFPFMEIEDLGYNTAVHGQKSYNGVAILSKFPLEDITTTLPGNGDDEQARYIEAVTGTYRVASVYVPNGQDIGTDKFAYKMNFCDRLAAHFKSLLSYEEKLIIGGDFNVAPEIIDVHDPKKAENRILCYPEERAKFRQLLNLGLYDSFRALYPTRQEFSWWDYREGSWQGNKGFRIDQLLLSPQAIDCLKDAGMDLEPRGKSKPSDHTPVWCELLA